MKFGSQHNRLMRIVAMVVVCLLPVNSLSFALAPPSKFKPLASIVQGRTDDEYEIIDNRLGLGAEENTGVLEKNTVVIPDIKCPLSRGIHMGSALTIGDLMKEIFQRTGILFYIKLKEPGTKIGYKHLDDMIRALRRGIPYDSFDADLQEKLRLLGANEDTWNLRIQDYKKESPQERTYIEDRMATSYKMRCYYLFVESVIKEGREYDIIAEGLYPRDVLLRVAEYVQDHMEKNLLHDPYEQSVAVEETRKLQAQYKKRLNDLLSDIARPDEEQILQVFREDTGFIYLSQLIGQAIELGLSAKGLKRLIEKHLSHIDFTRFRWQELYFDTETGGFSLPYVRKDNGEAQILRYYAKEKSAPAEPLIEIPIMEFDGITVVLEDPRPGRHSELGRTEKTKRKILDACSVIDEQLDAQPFVVDIDVIAEMAGVSAYTVVRYRHDKDVKAATDDVLVSDTDIAILEAIQRLIRDGKQIIYLTIAKEAKVGRDTVARRVEKCRRVQEAVGLEYITSSGLQIIEAVQHLSGTRKGVTVKGITARTGRSRRTISYQAKVNQVVRAELEAEGLFLVPKAGGPSEETDKKIIDSAHWFIAHGGAETQYQIAQGADVSPGTLSERKTANLEVKRLVNEALRIGRLARGRDFNKLTEAGARMTLDQAFTSKAYKHASVVMLQGILAQFDIEESRTIQSVFRDAAVPAYIKWRIQEVLMDELIASFYAETGRNAGQLHLFGKGPVNPVSDALDEFEELAAMRTFFLEKLEYAFPFRLMEKYLKAEQLNILHVPLKTRPIFDAHSSLTYGINICSTCEDRGRAIVHELMALAGFVSDEFNEKVDSLYKEWRDEVYRKEKGRADEAREKEIDAGISGIRGEIERIQEDSSKSIEQAEFLETDLDVVSIIPPHTWAQGGKRAARRKKVKGFKSLPALRQTLGPLKSYVEEAHAGVERKRSTVEHAYYRALPDMIDLNKDVTDLTDALLMFWGHFPALVSTCHAGDPALSEAAEDYVIFLVNRLTVVSLNQMFAEFQVQGLRVPERVQEAMEKAYFAEWSSSPTKARKLWRIRERARGGHIRKWSTATVFEMVLKEIAILSDRAVLYDRMNKPWLAEPVYRQACHLFRLFMRERALVSRAVLERGEMFELNVYDGKKAEVEKAIGSLCITIAKKGEQFRAMGIALNPFEEAYAEYRRTVREIGSWRKKLYELEHGPLVILDLDHVSAEADVTEIPPEKKKALTELRQTVSGLRRKKVVLQKLLTSEVLSLSVAERDFAKLTSSPPYDDDTIAHDLADTLILRALEARRDHKKIIIGLDTSWIPGMQQAAIQGLLNKLSYLSQRKGLDTVIVRRRNGEGLASALIKEVHETGTPLSHVVILGDQAVLASEAFDALRNSVAPESGAFFAGIQLPDGFPENSYLWLLEMLTLAVRGAFGEDVSSDTIEIDRVDSRHYIFIPKAEPVDLEILKDRYDRQQQALTAA